MVNSGVDNMYVSVYILKAMDKDRLGCCRRSEVISDSGKNVDLSSLEMWIVSLALLGKGPHVGYSTAQKLKKKTKHQTKKQMRLEFCGSCKCAWLSCGRNSL